MWERCPKCCSMFIEWDGFHNCYRCLKRHCQHTWITWPEDKGPRKYEDIKNVYLRLSMPPGGPVPYAWMNSNPSSVKSQCK